MPCIAQIVSPLVVLIGTTSIMKGIPVAALNRAIRTVSDLSQIPTNLPIIFFFEPAAIQAVAVAEEMDLQLQMPLPLL